MMDVGCVASKHFILSTSSSGWEKMESSCLSLRTLNFMSLLHNFRCRGPSLIRPFSFQQPKKKNCTKHFSLSCSLPSLTTSTHCLSERGEVNSLPNGVGEAVAQVSQKKLLQVVLVSPQIPGNTGCIARTCAASAVGLHLVEPLGFQVDDAKLKRAGLDYWPYVVVKIHGSWEEFRNYYLKQEGAKRLLAFTKRGTSIHSDFSYRRGDWLVFGSEVSGLPPEALSDCNSETLGGGAIRIPMIETYVRCLNLSVSVGIALYEAARQLDYEQLQLPSENCTSENYTDTSQESFITEDIFA